jgi:hypothetical protein
MEEAGRGFAVRDDQVDVLKGKKQSTPAIKVGSFTPLNVHEGACG